jgi:ectoine hydroxylase-related dioxygenase (phytanoyl-CoA dioxygenase family)
MDVLNARKFFQENGFVKLDGLLEQSAVDEVNLSILKAFNDNLMYVGEKKEADIQAAIKTLFSQDYDRYVGVVTSLYRKYSVQKIVLSDPIIKAIKEIFCWDEIYVSGGTAVHVVSDSTRTEGRYMGIQPHQDFPSVQGSLDGMVIWLPLMHIDEKNYPLEVIKGSHKSGIYPAYEDDVNPDWEIKPEFISNREFYKVSCDPRDVIFMSNFTVRRTGQHGNKDIRIACSTRVDNGDEKTFIARSYPSAYKRVVERKPMHEIKEIQYKSNKS